MSFVTTSMQRVRLTAAGRPEQLLGNWQKEAERRHSSTWRATQSSLCDAAFCHMRFCSSLFAVSRQ
jgi:hypothetical protein